MSGGWGVVRNLSIVWIHRLCLGTAISAINIMFQDKAGSKIHCHLCLAKERDCWEVDSDRNLTRTSVCDPNVDSILEESHFIICRIHFVKTNIATNDIPSDEWVLAIALVAISFMNSRPYISSGAREEIPDHPHYKNQMNSYQIQLVLEVRQILLTSRRVHEMKYYHNESWRIHNNTIRDGIHGWHGSFDNLPRINERRTLCYETFSDRTESWSSDKINSAARSSRESATLGGKNDNEYW